MMKYQGSNIKSIHLLLLLWLLRKKKYTCQRISNILYQLKQTKRLTNFIKILQILQALQNQQLNKNTNSQHPPFQHQRKQKYDNFIFKNKESLSLNITRSITLTCLSGKLN